VRVRRFLGAALLALLPAAVSASDARRPDVLLIVADTWRADALSCYAGGDATPNLDRLAAEGVLFEDAVTAAVFTPPSVASLLTGLYPAVHGVSTDPARFVPLSPSFTTLAERLREAGYRTAAYVNFGFDAWGITQGFDEVRATGRSLADVAPAAADFLAQDDARPAFVLLHFFDVHHPYLAAPGDAPDDGSFAPMDGAEAAAALRTLSAADPASAGEPVRALARRLHASLLTTDYGPALSKDLQDFFHGAPGGAGRRWTADLRRWSAAHPDDATLRHLRARYLGEVRRADRALGAFFDRLRASDRWERTLTAFVSDHGEGLGEDGDFLHTGSLSETSLRIPLLLRLPPGGPGRRVTAQVRSIDLMPTLLDAAGLPPADRVQGRSLLPLVRGETLAPAPALTETPSESSLRDFPWKLLTEKAGRRPRLRDVRPPPGRFHGGRPADDAAALRALKKGLSAVRRDSERLRALWAGTPPPPSRPPAAVEQELKDLGYIR
jgi:arylsulfatase A-like enzyme